MLKPPNPTIRVPAALLWDAALSPAAQLIWMVLRLDAPGGFRVGSLARRTGLSRITVMKALKVLAATGWLPSGPGKGGASANEVVTIPAGLLVDRRVSVRGRVLYGHLQLLAGFRHPSGRFTHADLCRLTGDHPKTVKAAVRDLAAAGWLQIARKNRSAPCEFSLRDPDAERSLAEVAQARRRLERAPFLGEALMREYLSPGWPSNSTALSTMAPRNGSARKMPPGSGAGIT